MIHYLCGKFAIEESLSALLDRLNELDFVGETDELDTWLPLLIRTLQLPNTVSPRVNVTGADHPRVLVLDPPLRDRIERDHPLDVELFTIARRDLFPDAMSRLRAEADAVVGVPPSDGHAAAVDR